MGKPKDDNEGRGAESKGKKAKVEEKEKKEVRHTLH